MTKTEFKRKYMQVFNAYEKARGLELEFFNKLEKENNINDFETPEIYVYLINIVEWGTNRDYNYTLDDLWEMIKTKKVM